MIQRLLVANRGEIALRVIRACREMGIETVAVYSDADRRAPHALAADRAVRIGPPAPRESYLDAGRLLEAAASTGADAVHPGYGFLSERPSFARSCEDAGLVFVGPPATAIERMGSKIGARVLMQQAGVPIVPGETPGDQSEAAIIKAAHRVDFPLVLKPSAGGGGIGMRVVREEGALRESVQRAQREAQAAFGDPTLYVERLVERPRHVEIQIFADVHGQTVHLFERECSLQRRHQKVVEESPCPVLSPTVRERMGEAAVSAAQAAGYVNAGTVEFLLEGEGDAARFYFLEMNTRLQVEHPVTEVVTGVDLVQAQLRVASGEPLPWRQSDLSQRGHAIECRVYAEDPGRDFLPQAGPLLLYREPRGPGIRVDSGVAEGDDVSVYYDPMLAKLVVWGETRELATRRALRALKDFPVLGVKTNIEFMRAVLAHPRFAAAAVDTGFLDAEASALRAACHCPLLPAGLAAAARHNQIAGAASPSSTLASSRPDPFDRLRDWRG